MGLEGGDHPAAAGHRACGLEVAADLDRVVGVGVEDPDAGDLALELHPAPGAGERPESLDQVVEGEAELESHREGGHRVEDVVASRDP